MAGSSITGQACAGIVWCKDRVNVYNRGIEASVTFAVIGLAAAAADIMAVDAGDGNTAGI